MIRNVVIYGFIYGVIYIYLVIYGYKWLNMDVILRL